MVLLCLVPMDCVAQNVDPFFGMQGGFATSNSPMEVFSNHYYPPRYTFSDSPARWGPTVGSVVNDKIEIRFEPSRNKFHFESLIGMLGRGGMGEVYRADDLKLGQPVALKFL